MERVMHAKWEGATLVDGALKLVRPPRVGRGRCPVQYSPVPPRTPAKDLPKHIRALQEYIQDTYGVDPAFSDPPTSAEIILAGAIVAGAKPYGPLDPDNNGLDRIVKDIPRWTAYMAWRGLLRCLLPRTQRETG